MAADEDEIRRDLERWIFGEDADQRFTQDSPVLPEVWIAYGQPNGGLCDLLLTPHAESSAAELVSALQARLEETGREAARLAYNESYVVAELSFVDLIHVVVPLSDWWRRREWPEGAHDLGEWVGSHSAQVLRALRRERGRGQRARIMGELAWFVGLVGRVAMAETAHERASDGKQVVSVAAEALAGLEVPREPESERPKAVLWAVNLNRTASTALYRSREAVKADAATRLFDISCAKLRWAVVDAGIDATHPAFRRRNGDGELDADPFQTRVVFTYDFTRLRDFMAGTRQPPAGAEDALDTLQDRLRIGREVDWGTLEPLLRVPHDKGYEPPLADHGTHVAGILAGDWREQDADMPVRHDLKGVCPDLEIYDLRVFRGSSGDEFPITAALQFVRYLNAHSDLQVIHGANLSLAVPHDVRNYACGRTPICDECDRLVASGVFVAVAAGNEGRAEYRLESRVTEGYRASSITDPGNAERVLTVGATHRFEPHTYGVSYFSSRGPTGDGRCKPDLVAPGEKIEAPVPNGGAMVKEGTSQAAPHASGAAALLMARHEELRNRPSQVKQILCDNATDLGRERYFQGAGMLDVLRAIQAV